jgi:hypothetical protein
LRNEYPEPEIVLVDPGVVFCDTIASCRAEPEERKDEDQPNREHWLNGWRRIGDSVLIGSGYRCAGCGKFTGLGCVALGDPQSWPEKMPDFPFEEATCPLCACRRSPGPVDKLTERLERLRKRDLKEKSGHGENG